MVPHCNGQINVVNQRRHFLASIFDLTYSVKVSWLFIISGLKYAVTIWLVYQNISYSLDWAIYRSKFYGVLKIYLIWSILPMSKHKYHTTVYNSKRRLLRFNNKINSNWHEKSKVTSFYASKVFLLCTWGTWFSDK